MSNFEENEAGTDPSNPESKLELSGISSGNDLLLEWSDLPFKLHVIEESNDLASWIDSPSLPTPSIDEGMRTVTLSDELASGRLPGISAPASCRSTPTATGSRTGSRK